MNLWILISMTGGLFDGLAAYNDPFMAIERAEEEAQGRGFNPNEDAVFIVKVQTPQMGMSQGSVIWSSGEFLETGDGTL